MKKAAFALTTLAALAAAPLALADGPIGEASSDQTPPGTPSAPLAQPGQTQATPPSVPVVTLIPIPILAPAPAPLVTPGPVGATTVTSGDATPIPTTPVHREPDTVTLNQTFRPNRPLLYTGGLIFLGTYGATVALTAANIENGNGDKTMYLPVVGPWMHLADIKESGTDTALVVGSGILQGAGVVLAIAGLFIPEKIPAATIQAGGVKVNLTAASFGRGSGGIGAMGQF